jgi:hypothetical protein
MDELVRIDQRQEDVSPVDASLLDTSGGIASMKRPRAITLAALSSAVLAFAAPEGRADSPRATDFNAPRIDASVEPTAAEQGDPDPVPEPTSMGLLGIGISGLITFRRFRKLFH